MENEPYDEVIGSNSAPFENDLAARCGLATDYHAVAHPSLPNYIAMTSGSTQGIGDDADPSAHELSAPSLFSQLGTRWRSLQESMPVDCAHASSGLYAVKHNPAAYFVDISASCGSQDVPLGATPDISSRFTFVTPNLCHDMHDCTVSAGDSWLSTFLPKVLGSPEYRAGRTAIFLTFDEDDGSAGNHVVTLVTAPTVPPGTRSSEAFTHLSLLRTTEEMLGLAKLGGAATAPSMRKAFRL
jgi:phospholipase C